ncbi:MAG TPA: NUDIX hydrolase [Ktedonobacteraceae bacterium]|nr:NUDIX hydrolase [Ktedonobacteraceae bacterium]
MLKQFLYRIFLGFVPLCFNSLNMLLVGNLPPLGCACVIVEDQGRFLLLKRPRSRIWNGFVFPGGFMRWREYPAETAQREFREETGLEVRLLNTTGTYVDKSTRFNRMSTLTIAFAGEVVGGTLRSGGVEGRPCWLDEFETRALLGDHYTNMLDDYLVYREQRKQS